MSERVCDPGAGLGFHAIEQTLEAALLFAAVLPLLPHYPPCNQRLKIKRLLVIAIILFVAKRQPMFFLDEMSSNI